MGSLTSKSKEYMQTPPTRPNILKRIEDPRSPTEEISRTPIEVTDRFSKECSDMSFSHRTAALKEQNKYSALDDSPRLRKTDIFGKDFKKLKSSFASAIEGEAATDTSSRAIVDKGASEKENNEL